MVSTEQFRIDSVRIGERVPEQKNSPMTAPPGYERRDEGDGFLVVRRELAEPVARAFAPMHQVWDRIRQRRFTVRGRAGVASFPLGKELPTMMVRRYVHGGLFASIGRDLHFGAERAFNELAVAEGAFAAGVRSPQPIGILAAKAGGPFWRLAFLSAEIPDCEDLIHYCCRLGEYPAETAAIEKRGVIRETANQLRKMHDAGILHGDLHLKNLLLQRRLASTPLVYVIDFDMARATPGPLPLEQRLRNLNRLARSVRKLSVADSVLTAWDRLRFLRDYLRDEPQRRLLMRQWARKLASSGRSHELWWTMTAAQRTLRGDGPARYASLRKGGKR